MILLDVICILYLYLLFKQMVIVLVLIFIFERPQALFNVDGRMNKLLRDWMWSRTFPWNAWLIDCT